MGHLKFRACLWKTLRARWASKFLTLSEIIFPALWFGVLVYVYAMDMEKSQKKNVTETYQGELYSEKEFVEEVFSTRENIDVLFSPPSVVNIKVMETIYNEVFKKHSLDTKLRKFEGVSKGIEVSSWLVNNFGNQYNSLSAENVGFGFIFPEKEAEQYDSPEVGLNYKIISTFTELETSTNFPHLIPPGRGESGELYIQSGLPVLQWYVEKTLIGLLNGEPVDFELKLHSFPYFKDVQNTDKSHMYTTVLLPVVTMMSFIFIIPVIIRRIVQEKSSGVKELQRIMGLNSFYLWISWLLNSAVMFIITSTIVTVILCLPIASDTAFLDFVDPSIVWVLFFLFCIASVFFCFAVSAFFNNPVAAMSCGVVLWIGTFTLFNVVMSSDSVSYVFKFMTCIFPAAAITAGFNVIAFYFNRRDVLNWDDIFAIHEDSNFNMQMSLVYLILLVDIFIFSVLTWYFDKVKPGPFGIARSWNFLCKKSSFRRKKKEDTKGRENSVIEEPSPLLKAGIHVEKLRKVYKGDIIGLDGVTMKIYTGVITVLLGHNGAGKTSLMSIISGLHSPTSGSVVVNGEDIFSHMQSFHHNLGICFQYNYLFSYLTVLEHFVFFGMVKGMSLKDSKVAGLKLIEELNLTEKKHSLVHKLSGGMLRRLSLAIALIGDPKVLLLDEPTCGMDPETRRDVWDIILKKRGSHTIVITTQFMEEADVLGDWIAILDHGKIVCYGTTPFLKKIYGTGYHLTISKDKYSNTDDITKIVTDCVPQGSVENVTETLVNYTLPMEETAKFPAMFTKLEDNKRELGILSIGLQCTTIEDVFLRVGEMLQDPRTESFTGFILSHLPNTVGFKDKLQGRELQKQQFKALLVKKLRFDLRNWFLFLIVAIILVAVVIVALPSESRANRMEVQKPMEMTLNLYKNPHVYASIANSGDHQIYDEMKSSLEAVTKEYGAVVNFTSDLNKALLDCAKTDVRDYRLKTISGVEFKGKVATVYFNNIPRHSVPVGINLVSNTLLNFYLPEKNSVNLITFSYGTVDLNAVVDTCSRMNNTHTRDNLGQQWAVSLPQCLLCVLAVFLVLPAIDRSCKSKHLQLMTGVTPLLYWLACFVWDFFLYCVLTLLIAAMIILVDHSHVYTSPPDLGVLIFILLLYGVSGTFYAYFVTNFGSSASRIVGNYMVFSICFGMITAVLVNVALQREYAGERIVPPAVLTLLRFIMPLCPHYALVTSVIMFGEEAYQNYLCRNCPEVNCTDEPLLAFSSKEHPFGILLEILYLSVVWILYLALLVLTDNQVFSNFCWKMKDKRLNVKFDEDSKDYSPISDIQREKEITLECSEDRSVDPKAIYLCVGLGKVYSRKSMVLQPLCFRVRKGECFGLLGTNGAGKSTTFKLLVGLVRPTVGDAVNFNATLSRDRQKYLRRIGYCPQVGGLNLSFTAEETLRLYAMLRGVNPLRVETEVDNWLRLLGLNEFRSYSAATYSSGTLRKLSAALALIGHPPVVFLDEPTAGVDPFGRRNLWEVLNASKDLGQAVLLTSHSMQECEALCQRLTIMVDGRMMCLGNTQYLKKKFGQGYTIAVVLHTAAELQDMIPLLKADMYKSFNKVKLKDEHKKLLHYHVKDQKIQLSELFSGMEQLKQRHPVIDTYILGDTTLEQVFISFAKKHIKPEIIL